MFERALYSVIKDGIDAFDEHPDYLRKLLSIPGWEEAEIDRLVTHWASENTHPHVIHGYARVGARFPCFAIVLAGERQDQSYLGDSLGLETYDVAAATALVAEVEAALGRPVTCGVGRWKFDYMVFTYAEHPEVCLAYYNALRSIFMAAEHKLLRFGMETPEFSGLDLAPDPRYMPENLFARQFNVSGYAHVLFAHEVGIGPWVLGPIRRVTGLHVANHVTGVTGGVTPVSSDDVE